MGDDAPRLVLASSSPRRQALLRAEGFEFSVAEPDVDESIPEGEPPERTAARLASSKARAVAERVDPDSCVLAADTIVVIDDSVLGKPRHAEEAALMLLRLAGRTHRVITGYSALLAGSTEESGIEVSRVRMRPVSPAEARAYAATDEPLDKAGGYAVQGEGGRFVEHIDGSRSNVIGLPLEAVVPALERLGVEPR
ncbi:MAG: Maf family protein [Myxococcota bacterium]